MGFAHWNVSYILFAPQRDAANRRRDALPFSFETSKENAPCTVEKKNVRDELTHLCQLTHTKERPVRTADKNQKSSAGCAESTQMT
ncbi:MAG: hypothetical protein ACLSHO_00175 [Dysosmobacter sp.]